MAPPILRLQVSRDCLAQAGGSVLAAGPGTTTHFHPPSGPTRLAKVWSSSGDGRGQTEAREALEGLELAHHRLYPYVTCQVPRQGVGRTPVTRHGQGVEAEGVGRHGEMGLTDQTSTGNSDFFFFFLSSFCKPVTLYRFSQII